MTQAHGHSRSESYSQWQLRDGDVRGSVVIPLSLAVKWGNAEAIPQQALKAAIAEDMNTAVRWSLKQSACQSRSQPSVTVNESMGSVRVAMAWQCSPEQSSNFEYQLHYGGLLSASSGHVHIARVYEHGQLQSQVFSEVGRVWTIDMTEKEASSIDRDGYLILGVDHVLTGWDHLAFLLALLLALLGYSRHWSLRRSLFLLLSLITGFTLGHSVSLVAASYFDLLVNVSLVEALIGFSIAFVALENLSQSRPRVLIAGFLFLLLLGVAAFTLQWSKEIVALLGMVIFLAAYLRLNGRAPQGRAQWMVMVTLFFGVIHGFGFANSLQHIGLPDDNRLWALLMFNLGVELGQILVVMACLVLLSLFRKVAAHQQNPVEYAWLFNSGLFGIGIYWWVIRLYGI